MAQKFDARQTISRDVLSQLLGINGTELDDLLRAINKEFNAPLRISASSPADAKINFQPSEVEAADLAAKNASPVSSQIPSFPASTIDFQTGATTGGTINITFPNSTVGFFRRIGFSLDASGTIQAIFSAEAATIGALANAGTVFVKGALPIGWIDLEATAASPGRFKTAGSATNIIENKVGSDNRVHRIMGGGGTGGSGSGSGTGDDINALTFKASFTDLFSDLPTDSLSAVDYSAGKTDASTYDIVNTYHRLAYDATLTVTGTGVNMTLSAPPAFTIKAGDVLVVGSEARRIASLTSQTVFALESAFSTDPAAAACNVSQAVHSKDLNNFAGDGIAVSTAFPTAINQILMTYEDTTAANDIIFDANTVAVVGFTASSDGSNYTNVQIRPQNLSDSQSIVNLPTSGTNLYLRLFANKTSGSGFVNILGYKAFFHRDLVYADGSVLNQAYARTDNTGTKVNVTTVSVVGGKTRIKTSFAFPVGVNAGSPNGSLKVYLDGQKIPRYVDGTVSITANYKEIDQNTIELDADYSSLALEIEVVQDVAVVDSSDQNSTQVAAINTHQFKNRLLNSAFDLWQRGTSVTINNNNSAYQADRWFARNITGTNGVITYSRVAGQLAGSRYGASIQITTQPTAAQQNGCEFYQVLENSDCLELIGQNISFAINIKALGNVTQVGLQFCYATSEVKATTPFGTEQIVDVNTAGFVKGTLSAQNSGSLPTSAGVISVRVRIVSVSSGNTWSLNNGFIVEQGQLVMGSVVPQFTRQGSNFSDELRMCQRYFEKTYFHDVAPASLTQTGSWYTRYAVNVGTGVGPFVAMSVDKRVSPTLTFYSPTTGATNTHDRDGTPTVGISGNVIGSRSFGTSFTTSISAGAGPTIQFHWAADSEI